MSLEGYHFDNLTQDELVEIKNLEMKLNNERKENHTDNEELLLLAFSKQK